MLTPAFSLTATERVLPRLALDFTTGVLDSRVTVTRALNTATRVNSSGLIELVNANLPRFDYDPTTLLPKGLLIEESRQNLCLYAEQFNNAAWNVLGGALVVTPDTAVAPDGTTTADTITLSSSFKVQEITVVSGAVYTFSVWMRSATASNYSVKLGEVNGSGSTVFTVTPTWQRFSLTFTKNAGVSAYPGIDQRSGASTSGSIYVWGAQLELGAFATSYIPTTTTSLTRNADEVRMTGTNFSDWYNATEGTIVSSFQIPVATGATRRAISINDGTTNDTIQIALVNTNNQGYVEIRDNLSIQVTATVGSSFTVGTPVKLSLAYKANSFAYAIFGGTTSTDPSGTVPTVSQMEIGSQLGAYMNGWMSKINYYPFRLTNAEVSAISK